MALHWRPVGPLPAAVYWRRRAGVLTALVLLLLLLRACSGGEEQLASAPAPTPSTTPSASPMGPTAVQECTDAALTVTAETSPSPVPAGTSATVRLTVVNGGTAACSRAGADAVELLVLSGRDRIWSSNDCPATVPSAAASPVVLAPGERQSVEVVWDGRRSRPGCPGEGEAAKPGTYRVLARVGALQVEGSSFRVE